VVVDGQVQGVFFRDTCRRMATATGVGGWVRNRADGRVEAFFEGDRAGVARMVAWCRQGPPGAGVTAVDVAEETPVGETRFRIR
jgi:acylphosphatase